MKLVWVLSALTCVSGSNSAWLRQRGEEAVELVKDFAALHAFNEGLCMDLKTCLEKDDPAVWGERYGPTSLHVAQGFEITTNARVYVATFSALSVENLGSFQSMIGLANTLGSLANSLSNYADQMRQSLELGAISMYWVPHAIVALSHLAPAWKKLEVRAHVFKIAIAQSMVADSVTTTTTTTTTEAPTTTTLGPAELEQLIYELTAVKPKKAKKQKPTKKDKSRSNEARVTTTTTSTTTVPTITNTERVSELESVNEDGGEWIQIAKGKEVKPKRVRGSPKKTSVVEITTTTTPTTTTTSSTSTTSTTETTATSTTTSTTTTEITTSTTTTSTTTSTTEEPTTETVETVATPEREAPTNAVHRLSAEAAPFSLPYTVQRPVAEQFAQDLCGSTYGTLQSLYNMRQVCDHVLAYAPNQRTRQLANRYQIGLSKALLAMEEMRQISQEMVVQIGALPSIAVQANPLFVFPFPISGESPEMAPASNDNESGGK